MGGEIMTLNCEGCKWYLSSESSICYGCERAANLIDRYEPKEPEKPKLPEKVSPKFTNGYITNDDWNRLIGYLKAREVK